MSPAPRPVYRLVRSQFPPLAAFEAVATAADLPAVIELEDGSYEQARDS